MPHITRGVGPTNEADYPVAVTIRTSRVHLITDTAVAAPEPAADEATGEEEPWAPGGSSTTSTSKLDSSKSSGEPTRSRRARTTASPSPKDPTGSGSAGTTGGASPNDEKPTEGTGV